MSDSQPTVPYGYCHCGCGQKTRIATKTDSADGAKKGEPRRFVRYHNPGRPREGIGPDYRIDPDTGCWVWLKRLGSNGYGQVSGRVSTGEWTAHRHYYALRYGPIPSGCVVHHRCHNRGCVNPEHLAVMTPRDHQRHHCPTTPAEQTVREIRRLLLTGLTQREIAARCGVSRETVSRIKTGRSHAGVL